MKFEDKKLAAQITIKGKLVKDVQFTDSQSWQVANISVMVQFSEKEDGEWVNVAIFHDCTLWNELATSIKSLKKGDFVLLTGEPRKQAWKYEGKEGIKDFVYVESIEQIENPFDKPNISKSPEHKAVETMLEPEDDIPF